MPDQRRAASRGEIAASELDAGAVGRRLAEVRLALGRLTQQELADKVGGTKRGIQENESGKTAPGAKVLHGLHRLGVNVGWVLTGQGPMMLRDFNTITLNYDVLLGVVMGVEEMLREENLEVAPEKKAELVTLLYEQCVAEGEVKKATILRLVKLAA